MEANGTLNKLWKLAKEKPNINLPSWKYKNNNLTFS